MKWIVLLLVVCKFNLGYWANLPKEQRQGIITAYALEYAHKFKGKARAYSLIDLEAWQVSIVVEPLETGV
jgi:hypothetical protein